jgi:hypothetical protein
MRRLVMYKTDLCVLCEKIDNECKVFSPDSLYGWIYCIECYNSGRMKNTYVKYIEKTKEIPLDWVFELDKYGIGDKDTDTLQRNLYFYRHSQRDTNPLYTGLIRTYDSSSRVIVYKEKNDGMFINLTFKDIKQDCLMSRLVSLENIFANNKDFYKDLCSNKPLIKRGGITLTYDELPKNVKEIIEKCYERSKKTSVFIK